MVMCSETASPRFSFSYDLSEQQHDLAMKQDVPCKDTLLADTNLDEFEFSTSRSLEFESSSADELFSNGVILPIQIKQDRTTTTRKHTSYGESPYMKLPPRPCSPKVHEKVKKESTREKVLDVNSASKSFWGFNRSKSLNCNAKKSMIFSLPLSRSNSTGSVSNPKRMSSNRQKSSCSTLNLYPLQKSSSGKCYANGLRISPVLNVPTPYISKGSVSLFGLGSFLGVGKVKKSKN